MVRRLLQVLLVLPMVASLVIHDAHAQTCAPAKTALVLSGGGAKGFAHIGVLEIEERLEWRDECGMRNFDPARNAEEESGLRD
jgi:hypothetical protein